MYDGNPGGCGFRFEFRSGGDDHGGQGDAGSQDEQGAEVLSDHRGALPLWAASAARGRGRVERRLVASLEIMAGK